MALHSLNKVRQLQDPLKQFQVKFTISSFPGLALAYANQKASALTSGNFSIAGENTGLSMVETLELRCTSYTYPGTKIAQSELVIAGFRRKLGTLQNKSGTWTCKITEDQNGGVMNIIQAWCDLIHNPFTSLKLPSTYYVSTCCVQIESADKKGSVYDERGRTIWLKGFYPIEYTVNEIDASSSKPVEITVKFNYDWWTETATSISALGVL